MDPVKKKVLTELFLAPSVVLPIVGGLSAGLLSWATAGSTFLTGAAVVGVLGGVGWMLTRMIFNVEDITENAMQSRLDQQLRAEQEELDRLAAKLRTDRDHRTQDYLTLLRSLRSKFETEAADTNSLLRTARVREQVGQVFHAAVEQLEQSFHLWEVAQKLSSDARSQVLAQRELALDEIEQTVQRVAQAVDQFRGMAKSEKGADLASMRDELDAVMRVAKRTEERMRELENPSADHEAFVKE